jgi:hypothetical protein
MTGRHGVTDQDIPWLVHGIKRLRSETHGAAQWDDAGIVAEVRKFIGQNFQITLERVFAHAADPEAKTPGALRRSFTPTTTRSTAAHPLKKDNQCLTCGQHLTLCPSIGCGEQRTRPARPSGSAEIARAALRGENA